MGALYFIERFGAAIGSGCLCLKNEILLTHLGILRHYHRPLHSIFQLAHIARPGLLLQQIHGLSRNGSDPFVHSQGELAHEVVHQ